MLGQDFARLEPCFDEVRFPFARSHCSQGVNLIVGEVMELWRQCAHPLRLDQIRVFLAHEILIVGGDEWRTLEILGAS